MTIAILTIYAVGVGLTAGYLFFSGIKEEFYESLRSDLPDRNPIELEKSVNFYWPYLVMPISLLWPLTALIRPIRMYIEEGRNEQ